MGFWVGVNSKNTSKSGLFDQKVGVYSRIPPKTFRNTWGLYSRVGQHWSEYGNFLHTLSFVYYISELYLFELLKKYFCNKLITDDEPLARFKQKFAHFAEFYELLEAVPGQRDNFALRFKCQLCKKPKIVKSDSKAPTSNLTSHINHCHPECSDDFSDAGPFKRAPRGRKNISASNNKIHWKDFIHNL